VEQPSAGRDRAERVALASWAIALVPLVVAAVRAIAEGWVPVGDSALIAVRARDVLGGGPGGDMPLLGMWASRSWSVGLDMNHPGPLLYGMLAVPASLIGGGAGVVVGTTLVNAAAVTGIFVVSRRVGGAVVATASMAVTAVLCWSLGSEVLVEPWHASTVLLPFLCLVVLVWAVVCGDRPCLPWAVLVGSLVVQTNLSYAVLVPALLLGAAVVLALGARRAVEAERRRTLVALGAAALVGLVCWLPPLVEQATGDGEGNLSRLGRSLGADAPTIDLGDGVRAVAQVVALPPWWVRPSYADDFALGAFGNTLPSLPAALAALAVVVALGAACLADARRRGDRVVTSAVALAGALVLLSLVTVEHTPTSDFGTIAYQMRWLWPVGAFVALSLVVGVVRHPWAGAPGRRWALAALAVVTVAAGAANLPASNQGTTAPAGTYPVARTLTTAVDGAELTGPLLVVCGEGVFDPYCEAVMAELQDDGVGFVVDESIGVRQLGNGRRADPARPLDQIIVVTGDYAVFTPPGARLVTLHEGLGEDEVAELFFLREDLKGAIAASEVRLDARGETVGRGGGFASVAASGDRVRIDPIVAVDVRPDLFGEHRRDLVAMVEDDLLDADPQWRAALDRYVELQARWDSETVAVYLAPAPPAG
jgi:hypothetical protein